MKNLIVSLGALLALSAAPAYACDLQEAIDLVVKVSTALAEKAGAAQTEEDSLRVTAVNAKMKEGDEALAADNPDKACEIYRAVAKEQGIPLE